MVEATNQNRIQLLWRALPEQRPDASALPLPECGQVHLYSIPLQVPAEELQRCSAVLAPEETQRAARFRFEQHRDRYLAGRGILRFILAGYLRVSPASVQFQYGPNGKPALAGDSSIQFNLAHSEELALLAVTRGLPVGVDLERVRVLDDFELLVRRFFSARESEAFHRLEPNLQAQPFFNLWTRKEALLKATGEGIAYCLNKVEVTFLPSEPARLLAVPPHFGSITDWRLFELKVQPEYTAALTVGTQPGPCQPE